MTPLEQSLFEGMQRKCLRLELEIIRLHTAMDSLKRLVNLGIIHPVPPVTVSHCDRPFSRIAPDWVMQYRKNIALYFSSDAHPAN